MLPANPYTWIFTKYGILFHFDHFCKEIQLFLILAIGQFLHVEVHWYFEYLFAKSRSLSHIFRFRKWERLAIWEQWEISMVQWRSITFTMFKPKRVKFLQLKTTNTHSCSFIFKIKRSILRTNMHSCLVSLGDICPDTIEWVSKGS